MHLFTATSVAALLIIALSGCGSDELPAADNAGVSDAGSEQDAADPAAKKPKPIEFVLPETTELPSGFRQVPSKCETDSDASKYRGWYNFAVPEDWESGGSVGGSSTPLDEGTTLSFGTGSDRASIEAKAETTLPDGSISDGQGGKWTTFDYDHSAGDVSGTVNFEEFTTVPIGGQNVTILAAPYQQDTEFLKVTEYKARIITTNTFGRFDDANRAYPASILVSIKPNKAGKELDKDVVSAIIGSYTMPQCVQESVIVSQEVVTHLDVDGDGKVATVDDLRELMNNQ